MRASLRELEIGLPSRPSAHLSLLTENTLDRHEIAIRWLSLLGNSAQALVNVLGHEQHPGVPCCDIAQALVHLPALRAIEVLLRSPNRKRRSRANFVSHRFCRLETAGRRSRIPASPLCR